MSHVALYVELMGRHSNLILVDDDGRIMESAKRVTPDMSRVRPVLPRLPYMSAAAPRSTRSAEHHSSRRRAAPRSVAAGAELARALVSSYRGISPVMAREIVFRTTGSSESSRRRSERGKRGRRWRARRWRYWSRCRQRPGVRRIYRERGHPDPGEVVACSPILMTHLAAEYDVSPVESMSEALALAESAADRPGPARHAQRRQRLLDVGGRSAGEGGAAAGGAGERVGAGSRGGAARDRRRDDLRLSLADRARSTSRWTSTAQRFRSIQV